MVHLPFMHRRTIVYLRVCVSGFALCILVLDLPIKCYVMLYHYNTLVMEGVITSAKLVP
jgi:hypothetical protein